MREPSIALFSYGTLQQPEVQLANYGRLIDGEADALPGFVLTPLLIEDPHVIAVSGKSVHMIAQPTGDPTDQVLGTVLFLTETELQATDAYEEEAYRRVQARLTSGRLAFVYIDEA